MGKAVFAQTCIFLQSTFSKIEKPLYPKKAILEQNYIQMWKLSIETLHLTFMLEFHKSSNIRGSGA